MSARYGIGARGTSGSVGTAQFDLTSQNNVRIRIYEFAVFVSAATASSLGLAVLKTAIGTGSAGVAPLPYDAQDPTPNMRHHLTWTVQPTAPSVWMRLINTPAAIGNGVIFRWPETAPLIIPAAGSLLLWNLAASAVCDIYYEAEE